MNTNTYLRIKAACYDYRVKEAAKVNDATGYIKKQRAKGNANYGKNVLKEKVQEPEERPPQFNNPWLKPNVYQNPLFGAYGGESDPDKLRQNIAYLQHGMEAFNDWGEGLKNQINDMQKAHAAENAANDQMLADTAAYGGKAIDTLGHGIKHFYKQREDYENQIAKQKADHEAALQALRDENQGNMDYLNDIWSQKVDELNGNLGTLQGKYDNLDSAFNGVLDNMGELQGKYDALNGDYGALQGKYDALNGDYGDLQGKYDALNGDYDALQGQHLDLENKHHLLGINHNMLGAVNQSNRDAANMNADLARAIAGKGVNAARISGAGIGAAAGGAAGYAGSNWLSKKLGLQGSDNKWKRYGDIALRTGGTLGGAALGGYGGYRLGDYAGNRMFDTSGLRQGRDFTPYGA